MKKGSKITDYTVLKKRAIILREEGLTQSRIGELLGVRQSTVNNWLQQYKKRGEPYLAPAKMGGHKKCFLSKEQEKGLAKILIEKRAEEYGFEGGFWTYKRIGAVIKIEYGVSYKERSVGDLLKRMGFSWQKPQKKVITKKKKK